MDEYKYDNKNINDKLVIIVKSQLELDICIEIGTEKYEGKDNKIVIEQFDTSCKNIVFTAKVKGKKSCSYRFFFHRHNSSGLLQWCKTINIVKKEIFFSANNKAKPIEINIDVGYFLNKNIYMIDDCFLTAEISNGTNAKIRQCKTCVDTKQIKFMNVSDYSLCLLKNIIWLIIGADLGLFAYKTRYEANYFSIFNGDMIWIDILSICGVCVSYTVFSFIRMHKFKSKEKYLISNL